MNCTYLEVEVLSSKNLHQDVSKQANIARSLFGQVNICLQTAMFVYRNRLLEQEETLRHPKQKSVEL